MLFLLALPSCALLMPSWQLTQQLAALFLVPALLLV
jgi:hypothetical protein